MGLPVLHGLKEAEVCQITGLTMQLIIRSQESYVLDFCGNETLAELKARIAEHEKTDDVILYVSGKPLSEDGVVSSLENCAVDVNLPLLGGKVHGSLARAGKVRGQTPKVDAQEKKKKKTGRAKRRIQYNRRFVNVVATFGRRRGPNSNS